MSKAKPTSEKSRSRTQSGSEHQGEKQPENGQAQFTLVKPLGVTNRPVSYRRVMLDDVKFRVSSKDPLAKVYCLALAELIRDMKRSDTGHRSFILEDGSRLDDEGNEFLYQFDFAEDANLFEGAKIKLKIGGKTVDGDLVGVMQGRIIVRVFEDYGRQIRTCILRIDNTALLQALCERLQRIENGDAPNFRADLATNVIKNIGSSLVRTASSDSAGAKLNEEQQAFIETALINDISWLWGPPGTGKTLTLTALTRTLYRCGERVLISSNTNQAVDQVLLKLCREMRRVGDSALAEGRILRFGRIEHEDLLYEFESQITVEGITNRKSATLRQRKSDVESKLLALNGEFDDLNSTLRYFVQLDEAETKIVSSRNELSRAEAKRVQRIAVASGVAASLAGLREEYEKWREVGAIHRIFLRSKDVILREIAGMEAQLILMNGQATKIEGDVMERQKTLARLELVVRDVRNKIGGQDRANVQRRMADCVARRQALIDELSVIDTSLRQIREAVLKDARIVGSTVTRTFLRPVEYNAFDTVIIDEASMILLPAVFHAAGIAEKRVVIAGDFRQLSPILPTDQKRLHKILGLDIFHVSGVAKSAATGSVPRFSRLMTQYRMDAELCRPISTTFYRGALKTASDRSAAAQRFPAPVRAEDNDCRYFKNPAGFEQKHIQIALQSDARDDRA